MTILIIRASHANEFELQNYAPIADKHDIRVITSRHPLTDISLPTTELWSPTDLPDFPFRRQLLNRLIGGEQWLPGLSRHLKQKRYHDLNHDIIHTAETYTPYTHQAVQLRKEGKIDRLVVTCWETIPHNNQKFQILRRWKQEAYQYVDLFHTPTKLAMQALIAEGVSAAKIRVIPYGVDLARFKPVKHKKNKRPLILTVARLEKEKGMEVLEQTASILPQADFLVVGKGSYQFSAPNITTRTVPYQEIHRLYQSADIFYLPSLTTPTWEEQYGMALVEAMACGLPIVTTHSGAIPEVVGDLSSHSLEELISSPSLQGELSKNSLTRASTYFDRTKQAAKLLQLYN